MMPSFCYFQDNSPSLSLAFCLCMYVIIMRGDVQHKLKMESMELLHEYKAKMIFFKRNGISYTNVWEINTEYFLVNIN